MTYESFLEEMTGVLEPLIAEAGLGQMRRESHFLHYRNIDHITSEESQGDKIRLGVFLKNLKQGDSPLKRHIDKLLPTRNNLKLGQEQGQVAVVFKRETSRDFEYEFTLNSRKVLLKVGRGKNNDGCSRKSFELEIDIDWGRVEHFAEGDKQHIKECYELVLGLMPQKQQGRDELFDSRGGGQGCTIPPANPDAPNSIAAGNPDGYAKEDDDDGAGNQNARGNLMRNKIVFGAPGTGKSFRLKEEAKKKSFAGANCERVTFYATYSYAQFVGSYKPVMQNVGGAEKISYEFVPGPFLRTLVKALNKPKEKFLLIIEEINRANAAAVFGDVFQLLDRDADGVSEYSIAASEDVKKYLVKELTEDGKQTLTTVAGAADMLKIPANLYLWATMNSADQGVFPLDTAFKRRWSFEYIGIDEGESQAPELKIMTYDWKMLRKFLNRLLVLNGVNEDKLMGPFFLKVASEFDSKVLMYLWEDAARMCRRAVFGEIKTYSELCKNWGIKEIAVFNYDKVQDEELKKCEESIRPSSGQENPAEDSQTQPPANGAVANA